MATPKKGSKPIKITLTENQISDIITQTARTRKGLKAESLEDRIAPSMIGAPIDPSLVPLPGVEDPTDPALETGLPDDPTTAYDPFVPSTDPTNPPLPGVPLPAFDDPTTSQAFPGGMNPQFPGGFGAQFGPTAPVPLPLDPTAPPSPFVGSGAPGSLPGTFGGGGFGDGQLDLGLPSELPLDPADPAGFVPPPAPLVPTFEGEPLPGGEPLPVGGEPLPEGTLADTPEGAPIVPAGPDAPTNDGPTREELQSHRQNILRQLRGQ